ncbi:AAA family ATPase [Schleiferilactobacillus shenzhenensis]|uniref:Nuclease SbcCD subunit C n=1 Tax=Schleiferilactobacillus shenzhenensis LY-73 TaxID=1231336 RepID=U4TKI5_9LACO|nr:AAA family ATPase [Schleiferilactobacillus shenzhenensis]ERL65341.1 SbcC [Schleiferilactobacillus shenzhenensis LY-73]
MIPKTIVVRNFGPYVDETLDFTRFAEVPLFLISGKTGSGKSTLFDAMRFALYGDASVDAGEREGASLRSNFADETEPSRVTFTFTQDELTYVLSREPKQRLKKKRGEGYKEYNATAKLAVFKGKKQLHEYTKTRSVDDHLRDLLGLTAEQFTQIVLLPQGEFRKFLNADSNEKEGVLRQLFGTAKYRRWGDVISQHAKAAQNAASRVDEQLSSLLQQLPWPETMTEEVTPYLTSPLNYQAQWGQFLETLHSQQQAEVQAAQTAQQAAQKKLAASQDTLHAGQELAKQRQSAAALRTRQAALAEQRDDMTALTQQISQLEFSQTLLPLQQRISDRQTRLAEAQQTETASRAQLATAQQALQAAEQQLADLVKQQPAVDQAREQAAKLTDLLPQFAKVAAAKKQAAAADRLLQKAQAAVKEQTAALAEQQAALQKAQAAAAQQSALLTQQNQLDQQKHDAALAEEHLHTVTAQWQAWQQAADAVAAVSNKAAAAAKKAQELAAAYQQTKSDWAAGQIARLSQDLLPGQPCPVCGSLDHPEPAVSTVTVTVTDAQRDAAEQAWQKASQRQAALASEQQQGMTQLQKAASQLQAAWQTYQPEADVPTDWPAALTAEQQRLAQQRTTITAAQRANQTALKMATQAAAAAARLQPAIDQQQKAVTTAQDQANAADKAAAQAQTTAADAQAQLPADYPTAAALQAAIAQLTAQVQAQQKAQTAAQQAKEQQQTQVTTLTTRIAAAQHDQAAAQAQLTDDQQQLTVALADHTPTIAAADLPALFAALKQLPALRQQRDEYQTQMTTVAAQLVQVEAAINGQPAPDVAALQAAVATLQADANTANQAFFTAQAAAAQTLKAEKEMARLVKDQADQAAIAREWAQLSETVNGKGAIKLSLERYVLRAYLQEVLRIANSRLDRLTNGRYELQLHKENGAYATNTGLELDVFDDNVGATRSVHTLSGGESFLTALSLALALGEVVQNESGGIQINALFVDEGFGSLDEDALAGAIDALQSIEGQQRIIGIISHVRELRQQIPDQLWVETEGDGRSRLHYPTSDEIEAKAL